MSALAHNGRHARLLADVIVMNRGRVQFTWESREKDY